MKVLITGGAGFIGSHIAEELVRENNPLLPKGTGRVLVRILDNLSTGRESNLDAIPAVVDFRKGDLCDPEALRSAVEGMDYIFHHAAMVSVHQSVAEPGRCHAINATGTLGLLMAAKEAGVKKVLFASSSAVYGESPVTPKAESLAPDTISPYAATKMAGELYCRMFSKLYGLPTVSFRYFNVFGPRQDPKSQYAAVIPKFAEAIRAGKTPTIFGDGEQTRDFVFVKDVVQANLRAAFQETIPGSVYNVGRGEKLSLNQLIELFRKILGAKVEPKHVDPVPGDIKHSLSDISKIKNELGFKPLVSIEEGLRALLGVS